MGVTSTQWRSPTEGSSPASPNVVPPRGHKPQPKWRPLPNPRRAQAQAAPAPPGAPAGRRAGKGLCACATGSQAPASGPQAGRTIEAGQRQLGRPRRLHPPPAGVDEAVQQSAASRAPPGGKAAPPGGGRWNCRARRLGVQPPPTLQRKRPPALPWTLKQALPCLGLAWACSAPSTAQAPHTRSPAMGPQRVGGPAWKSPH